MRMSGQKIEETLEDLHEFRDATTGMRTSDWVLQVTVKQHDGKDDEDKPCCVLHSGADVAAVRPVADLHGIAHGMIRSTRLRAGEEPRRGLKVQSWRRRGAGAENGSFLTGTLDPAPHLHRDRACPATSASEVRLRCPGVVLRVVHAGRARGCASAEMASAAVSAQ